MEALGVSPMQSFVPAVLGAQGRHAGGGGRTRAEALMMKSFTLSFLPSAARRALRSPRRARSLSTWQDRMMSASEAAQVRQRLHGASPGDIGLWGSTDETAVA